MFPSLKLLLQAITGTKAKLMKIHNELDKVLDMIIEAHKEKLQFQKINGDSYRKDDLVNLLLRLQENGTLEFPFTTDNIKAVILVRFLLNFF